ncbi:ABC transporter ATP-binding protein [Candidatus Omnitrophota bacterium]
MIEIVDIHKTFEDNHVLRGVNLKVNEGETLVIIGRSGCGKSLLLKHMIGIMKPDRGQLYVDGEDVCACSPEKLYKLRLQISMLFQGAALFDSLSVAENVGFALAEHTDKTNDKIEKIVNTKLELVGLAGIGRLKPAELSGGMKKRIGLARAICNDPKIILYDEPTTGLDPIMADIINDLIIDLNHKLRVTSIVVTHDMTSAYKVADRIAMLFEGKIIGIGTPDEIKETKDPIIAQFIEGNSEGPITKGYMRYRGRDDI